MKEKSFFEVVRGRRSIRAFKDTPVDKSVLERIMQVCDMTPSSGGFQSFEVYQISSKNMKEQLVGAAMDQEFISQAPLVLLFCANPVRSGYKYGERSKLFSVQDAAIAAAYTQLTVQAMGLATVWVGAFNEQKVSEIARLPADQRPVAILPIGYPAEKPKDKTTRGPQDLLHVAE
ncbi:nitroreductase family protein [Nitrososphaera sp.]|uniref:nitroreductase family protein n=1 Tax=Nitrososphaera sp. TaxID=1971748 RepID=UPI00316BA8C6